MTFEGKSVLVTGAGGSIGSQLCDLVAQQGARKLTLVSLTENGLYNIDRHLRGKFGSSVELVPILGSVRDVCLMESALNGVDSVVHAAAHKHVPICEQNPVEAIRNNVFGTRTLAQLSQLAGVKSFCMISSDKAVLPASIMGATKRLAELLIADRHRYSDNTRFLTVRFGNVLDSAGSVLPLWREQVRAGGPLTLTDERCERYFMSIPQAVGLVVSVIGQNDPGTFVLDMGEPKRLIDLARDVMREVGQEVPIRFIGLRPGEKLTEELHHGGELCPTGVPGVWRVTGDVLRRPPPVELRDLEEACFECDQEKAVRLLWSLVR